MTDTSHSSQRAGTDDPLTGQQASNADAAPFECPAGRWWVCALLGAVLLAGSVFVMLNVVAASIVSAIMFAATMVVVGVFQIAHAIMARGQGWGPLALSLVIGILFVVGGGLLLTDPLATSLGLTLGLAAVFIATGVVRLVLAFRQWRDYGWMLLASGLLGILMGVLLILGFPWSGLVFPGIVLGLDLAFHGAWWLTLGLFVRRPRAEAAGPAGATPAHA